MIAFDQIDGKAIHVRRGVRAYVRRNEDGWYEATSPDMPGLFVCHPDLDAVIDDLAPTVDAIRAADAKGTPE
jgi:hypothetical protein